MQWAGYIYTCPLKSPYVLRSSGISQKSAALIVRYSQKKKWISSVFYCSENPSIAHNLGTTGPIQVGFQQNGTSPNEHFNQIENWKCHMCKFRLITSRSHHIYCGQWHWSNLDMSVVSRVVIQPLPIRNIVILSFFVAAILAMFFVVVDIKMQFKGMLCRRHCKVTVIFVMKLVSLFKAFIETWRSSANLK